MSTLRLTSVSGVAVGTALASVEVATLVRRGADVYLQVPTEATIAAMRDLAFAGIAADPTDADLTPAAHLDVGIGLDLMPLAADLSALDILRLERVPLGAATAEIIRRRIAGALPPDRAARDHCRALLRGECVLFRWGRRVWATRAAIRARSARSSIRPVVFDRAAIDRWTLQGRICTRDDALPRWVFP